MSRLGRLKVLQYVLAAVFALGVYWYVQRDQRLGLVVAGIGVVAGVVVQVRIFKEESAGRDGKAPDR